MYAYDEDNDGGYPDESPVEVAIPAASRKSRATASSGRGYQGGLSNSAAPRNGTSASRSGSWPSCAGRRAPRGTASRNLCYPCCFRDGSEIRPRPASSGPAAARRGASR